VVDADDRLSFRAVFERAAKGIESCLHDCLEQFRNQITVGLGDVVQFEVLQRMQPGDETSVCLNSDCTS
jgi:hypothetical protein